VRIAVRIQLGQDERHVTEDGVEGTSDLVFGLPDVGAVSLSALGSAGSWRHERQQP
jgi:hypothetical protein